MGRGRTLCRPRVRQPGDESEVGGAGPTGEGEERRAGVEITLCDHPSQ